MEDILSRKGHSYRRVAIGDNARDIHLGDKIGVTINAKIAARIDYAGHYSHKALLPVSTFVDRPTLHKKLKMNSKVIPRRLAGTVELWSYTAQAACIGGHVIFGRTPQARFTICCINSLYIYHVAKYNDATPRASIRHQSGIHWVVGINWAYEEVLTTQPTVLAEGKCLRTAHYILNLPTI